MSCENAEESSNTSGQTIKVVLSTVPEFEKQPVELDMEFNLSVSDLFEYNNNILFISQAGDYIKIINGKLHVSNENDYKEVSLTKYWLNEKFRKVKNQTISSFLE